MGKIFRLDGKVAIITGGAGFLGKHFSLGLADAGAQVVVSDIDGQSAADVASRIRDLGGSAISIECDVAQEDQVINLVKTVRSELGRIDVLHNNAASKGRDVARFFDPFEEYDLEVWREVNSVNIDGMFLVAREVGKVMVQQRSGSIIQTSSIYGSVAPDQRIYEGTEHRGLPINTPAVYSTSKAAVNGLTKYLASYWGAFGVRVNTLTPGGIGDGHSSLFEQKYSDRVPVRRMGRPDDLIGALIYLASDSSSYVTGQNIIVDGGWTVW